MLNLIKLYIFTFLFNKAFYNVLGITFILLNWSFFTFTVRAWL